MPDDASLSVDTRARAGRPPDLLEPLAPAPGSVVDETPGGSIAFAWHADEGSLRGLSASQALRTDFCVRVAGERSGFFIMQTVPVGALGLTLPFEEIHARLGPTHSRAGRVHLEWRLCLSVANDGPFFTSRDSDLHLVAPRKVLRKKETERTRMRRRLFAAFLLVVLAAVPALASDRPAGPSAPPASSPSPGGVSSRPGSPQIAPVVTLPNRFATPGEKIKLEADVKHGGSALSGFALAFFVDGKKAGDAKTDASGKATLEYTVPGDFVQKHYEVDAKAPHVQGKGDLSIFKCKTVMKVGNFSWGTYKGEPGAPSGTYTFTLTRISDGKGLSPAVPVEVTVNGAPYNPGHVTSDAVLMPLPDLPAGQKTWKVRVAFARNASYLASADEATFTKP